VDELLSLLDLDPGVLGDRAETETAARRFAVRVPRGFVARMRRGDPSDPLLRQVLPVAAETVAAPGFTKDPVGELGNPPAGGVLAKYRGRALIVATGACAVHCRFCFRRHFPYAEASAAGEWDASIARLTSDPDISEVIFSGGDPMTLPDTSLGQLAAAVAGIPHVRRLRIHTRLPIVVPQRVDEDLVTWMGDLNVPLVVVVHVNHAREIDHEVRRALRVMAAAGAVLLNQAVLLRGVNDSVAALSDLGEELFDAGVLPYYLHLLDPVEGAAHFEVAPEEARSLHTALGEGLPGYLVPRLVREIPGAPAKVPVDLW
jgi:EF-P beta-lysylation protein EpmB